MMGMTDTGEFNRAYAWEQLRRSRNPLRRLIKHFYMENILRDVSGPTVEFGCGAGQLLARLPTGSLGLEVNPFLVEDLLKRGLNLELYNSDSDDFSLCDLKHEQFSTLVMAHVLEHFADPATVLRKLFRACARVGIRRLIFVVPGAKGYSFDKTHKTFINRSFLESRRLNDCEGYSITKSIYFPINLESVGKHFTFHELKVVYDQTK